MGFRRGVQDDLGAGAAQAVGDLRHHRIEADHVGDSAERRIGNREQRIAAENIQILFQDAAGRGVGQQTPDVGALVLAICVHELARVVEQKSRIEHAVRQPRMQLEILECNVDPMPLRELGDPVKDRAGIGNRDAFHIGNRALHSANAARTGQPELRKHAQAHGRHVGPGPSQRQGFIEIALHDRCGINRPVERNKARAMLDEQSLILLLVLRLRERMCSLRGVEASRGLTTPLHGSSWRRRRAARCRSDSGCGDGGRSDGGCSCARVTAAIEVRAHQRRKRPLRVHSCATQQIQVQIGVDEVLARACRNRLAVRAVEGRCRGQ